MRDAVLPVENQLGCRNHVCDLAVLAQMASKTGVLIAFHLSYQVMLRGFLEWRLSSAGLYANARLTPALAHLWSG